MKHIVILGDGMADEPIEALGGLTPLQAADTPYMDKLAALGRNGRLKTVPDGFHPGSDPEDERHHHDCRKLLHSPSPGRPGRHRLLANPRRGVTGRQQCPA